MKGTVLYSSIMSGLCFVAAVGDHSDLRTLWIRVFFRHRDLPGNCERHCPVEETYDYLSVTPPLSLYLSQCFFSLLFLVLLLVFLSSLFLSLHPSLCLCVFVLASCSSLFLSVSLTLSAFRPEMCADGTILICYYF